MKLGMVAGEASGDLLAGLLMGGLKTRWPDLQALGIGGPQMAAQGFEAWWPSDRLAVHGYAEALKVYRQLVRLRRQLGDRLLAERPDVFIGIDAPDFNLGLEARLKGTGLKTVHFVCPSIWAWRGGRVHRLAASADHVLCLFPFEPELLAHAGVAASYVGHPLADAIPLEVPRTAARAALGLAAGQAFVLALFHPVVQQAQSVHAQTTALCKALLAIGLPVVWLAPNADAGSRAVLQALDDHALPTGSQRVQHLSRPVFVAAMRYCAVLVGNSSAGIIEAASLGTPVVNVGSRQNLRERNANVVDVAVDVADVPVEVANVAVAIEAALRSALDHGPWPRENIYGDGHSGERIAHLLAKLPLDRSLLEKANAY